MGNIKDTDKTGAWAPFDEPQSTDETGFDVKRVGRKPPVASFMSTRAAVFTALLIISFAFSLDGCSSEITSLATAFITALASSAAFIVLWAVSLRFFEQPSLVPVSLVLNTAIAVAAAMLLPFNISLPGMIILSGAVTCLTVQAGDEENKLNKGGFTEVELFRDEFVKASHFEPVDIRSEVLRPFLYAAFVSLLGSITVFVIRNGQEGQSIGLTIFFASIFLMIMSFVLSSIRGTPVSMSSKTLSDPVVLPSVGFRHIRSFVLRRIRFAISLAAMIVAVGLFDYLEAKFDLGLGFMRYVLPVLVMFVFAFFRGRNTKHMMQFVMELCFECLLCLTVATTLKTSVFALCIGVMSDVAVTGLIFTSGRRLIHSDRSAYVSGMPYFLMAASFITRVAEIVLYSFGVVI